MWDSYCHEHRGELAYWGTEVDRHETPETKRRLGINLELSDGGNDCDETRRMEKAVKLIKDPMRGNRNARQTMLKHKQAHGVGCMPTFPTEQEIAEAMEGYEDGHMVQVYGDGSLTTPPIGGQAWAAMVRGSQTGTCLGRMNHIETSRTYACRP